MNPQETISTPTPTPVPTPSIQKIDGSGVLFKFGWKLLVDHWKTLVLILIVPTILIDVAFLIISQGSIAAIVAGTIIHIVAFILSIASIPALVNAIQKLNADPATPISFKEQYKIGFNYFWSYVLVIIIGLFVGLGSFMLLIIPGIIVSIYTVFYVYTLIVDNKKGFSSLTESYALVRGRWWPVLGRLVLLALALIVAWLIVSGINSLIGSLFGIPVIDVLTQTQATSSIGANIIMMLISLIFSTIVGLFSIGYTYRLYLSLKATRQENVSTSGFKKWLIAFICVGVIGSILLFITIPLIGLQYGRTKALDVSVNAEANMAKIRAEIEKQMNVSTVPVIQK